MGRGCLAMGVPTVAVTKAGLPHPLPRALGPGQAAYPAVGLWTSCVQSTGRLPYFPHPLNRRGSWPPMNPRPTVHPQVYKHCIQFPNTNLYFLPEHCNTHPPSLPNDRLPPTLTAQH